jgi:hypothetical protein
MTSRTDASGDDPNGIAQFGVSFETRGTPGLVQALNVISGGYLSYFPPDRAG